TIKPVLFLLLLLGLTAAAVEPQYELSGRFNSDTDAAVSLFGVASPFTATVMSIDGHFNFKKLSAGAYTLALFVPGRGEARQTIEIGPSTADAHQRVTLALNLKDSDFVTKDV